MGGGGVDKDGPGREWLVNEELGIISNCCWNIIFTSNFNVAGATIQANRQTGREFDKRGSKEERWLYCFSYYCQ